MTAPMLSAADKVLSKLARVSQSDSGGWLAACPAHDDNGQCLSVTEVLDGTVVVECSAGCNPMAVVRALGLSLRDLFPNKLTRQSAYAHARADALEVVAMDAILVRCLADDVSRGRKLNSSDKAKLKAATERLQQVCRHAWPMAGREVCRHE